ncbi:EF-hand calcium-binding domain-containing protein 1 [Octopus vulgaris]|uniref:EF-hand calcium-binding domain-containing protein 1 n=3 Tax=Octopus TaxID=6643 RepID=A0AA36FM27_OCTVU|nr:EF-hand calcium-binding domain-containing protein 1-like [Octopus sinensis]CAI9741919.1 EF-hand calcium-binding domain-containing protein 1 [Octopus vulgaris]
MKPIVELAKISHFSRYETNYLIKMYQHYTDKKLDRIRFRDILLYIFGMTNDILMDRVFRAFDKDNDSWISIEEWIGGLSVFLRGNNEEKMAYCFDVYDLNGDGYISREEMFQMLKNCLIKQPTEEDPDEGIKDLVDMVLKKMDVDHDARLSFSDYRTSVIAEPLLIEAFGPCLPTEEQKELFMTTRVCDKIPGHVCED